MIDARPAIAALFADAQAPLADRSRALQWPRRLSLRVDEAWELEAYRQRLARVNRELRDAAKGGRARKPALPRRIGGKMAPPFVWVVPPADYGGKCAYCDLDAAGVVLGTPCCSSHARSRRRTGSWRHAA